MHAAQLTETPAEQSQCDKPFDQIWVTLTKREHIELVMDANYWKAPGQPGVCHTTSYENSNMEP